MTPNDRFRALASFYNEVESKRRPTDYRVNELDIIARKVRPLVADWPEAEWPQFSDDITKQWALDLIDEALRLAARNPKPDWMDVLRPLHGALELFGARRGY